MADRAKRGQQRLVGFGLRHVEQRSAEAERVESETPIRRSSRRARLRFRRVRCLFQAIGDHFLNQRERYARFIQNVGSTVFRDVPVNELLRFNNHLLNYEHEAALDQLAGDGLSPDYVARETKRALEGVGGKCRILPGIDIGIPTGSNSRKASPDDTHAATLAALRAGADGLIFSRKYSEMRLENLTAAGKAVREFTNPKA